MEKLASELVGRGLPVFIPAVQAGVDVACVNSVYKSVLERLMASGDTEFVCTALRTELTRFYRDRHCRDKEDVEHAYYSFIVGMRIKHKSSSLESYITQHWDKFKSALSGYVTREDLDIPAWQLATRKPQAMKDLRVAWVEYMYNAFNNRVLVATKA